MTTKFPELSDWDNATIDEARRLGWSVYFPALPDADTQAKKTFEAADKFIRTQDVATTEEAVRAAYQAWEGRVEVDGDKPTPEERATRVRLRALLDSHRYRCELADGITWFIVTAMDSGWSGYWGRGHTEEEATAKALKMAKRTKPGKFKKGTRVLVQRNIVSPTFQRACGTEFKDPETDLEPYVSDEGSTYHWGKLEEVRKYVV